MNNISKILVPTDFSAASQKALDYARMIAAKYGASVTAFHSYIVVQPIEGFAGMPATIDPEMMKEHEKALTKKMKHFIQGAYSGPDDINVEKVPVHFEIELGMAVEEIVNRSKEEYDMIVMGASGDYGLVDRFMGSISSAVSRHAHCPVLVVPAKASGKAFHNMLYAGNRDSANRHTVQLMIDFAKLFTSRLHVVHVSTKDQASHLENELYFDKIVKETAPPLPFKVTSILEENNAWTGIQHYAKENDIDMIAVVAKHRSFWDSLWHKSVSKQIVMHTDLPVMIYHVDD